MGICHGLNSANSPRIVTSTRQGKLQLRISENMLMQLPTPLLCIRSAARSPPSVAPATNPTPSSSVVRTTSMMSESSLQRWIRRLWPASRADRHFQSLRHEKTRRKQNEEGIDKDVGGRAILRLQS